MNKELEELMRESGKYIARSAFRYLVSQIRAHAGHNIAAESAFAHTAACCEVALKRMKGGGRVEERGRD